MLGSRLKHLLVGGSSGNEQLTLAVAALLNVRALLTVHAFVGMLLIPPVALKASGTGWHPAWRCA